MSAAERSRSVSGFASTLAVHHAAFAVASSGSSVGAARRGDLGRGHLNQMRW